LYIPDIEIRNIVSNKINDMWPKGGQNLKMLREMLARKHDHKQAMNRV
jgi:hypothetical protein